MDDFFRGLIDREFKLGRLTLSFLDFLLIFGVTAVAFLIRFVFKGIVTDDWIIFWEPWINAFNEYGGFKALRGDFFYDYAPPFMYILYLISILPFNYLTAYKAICGLFDFAAAITCAMIVYECTRSKVRSVGAYSVFLIIPTVVANSSLWAQCDIIYVTFILICILFILKEEPNKAMIFYGMAFAFKLQTLFIFPLFIILWAKNRVKIKHFLWIIVMYFAGIIPAWIAGRPLMELINIYIEQGVQDAYSLSLKWSNIYQIFGTTFFIKEYESAGMWLILGILMCIMFYMAYKKYEVTKEFIILSALFFAILTPYFLPHMHERYGFLADIFAVIYAFINIKRFYYPVVHIMLSFSAYMEYLSKTFGGPIPYYSFVLLIILVLVGLDVYRYINDERHGEKCLEDIILNG